MLSRCSVRLIRRYLEATTVLVFVLRSNVECATGIPEALVSILLHAFKVTDPICATILETPYFFAHKGG